MNQARQRANALISEAFALEDEGKHEEAARLMADAAAADPTFSAPWFNLGLRAKHTGDWPACRELNLEALKRNEEDEGAWWNLAIAATALGDWRLARRAWRNLGLDVPDGDGPVEFPCGMHPIRLNPSADGEVVWAKRLDPARARLVSIPFPESGFRFGDVVLNDGSPEGSRILHGKEVAVFNALGLLERSALATYLVEVTAPHDEDAQRRMQDLAFDAGGAAEDWSHSVRFLCRACSEGVPDGEHTHARRQAEDVRVVAVAARDLGHANTIADSWRTTLPGVEIHRIDQADSS